MRPWFLVSFPPPHFTEAAVIWRDGTTCVAQFEGRWKPLWRPPEYKVLHTEQPVAWRPYGMIGMSTAVADHIPRPLDYGYQLV